MALEAYTSDALAVRRPLPEDALLIFGSGETEDRRLALTPKATFPRHTHLDAAGGFEGVLIQLV